jgi:cysteinyl-tRNA synthetase
MPIRLYDSLTREFRELKPAQPDGVFRMYCCGPTVYAPAHIGNFRTFLIQDVLRRLLELEFGPDKVRHVRNLTDVDDRTIAQAKREQRPLAEITKKWTDKFHEDCRALNILPMDPPHVEPTATSHIPEQVAMINELLAKGLAYVARDGSVYYKIAAFPRYGALSRIKERELKATVTTADDDHKDDASDFALWKAYKPDEDGDVKWPGPQGAADGRPGWHIECSAMSRKHLGETIDLHAGGVDLLFPHHENEIAQSEGCTGHTFSRHWYHSEHLLVDGTTMSKSKGNYYTVDDLVKRRFSPVAIRYALLAGHPRKQLNFTLESLGAAVKAVAILDRAKDGFVQRFGSDTGEQPSAFLDAVLDALRNDLNIPAALGALFSALNSIDLQSASETDYAALKSVLWVLGINIPIARKVPPAYPPLVAAIAQKRLEARLAKDFKTADALRQELAAAGWSVLDSKDDYRLEPLRK